MLSWAEHEFALNKTDDQGISEREHLAQVERQLGYTPDKMRNPEKFPRLLLYIWTAFCDLSNTRSSNGFGLNPLSHSEIYHWLCLTQTPMSSRDIRTLKKLDQLFIGSLNG